MFLECRNFKVTVPQSNEVSLVFPFNQCSYQHSRNSYDPKYLDETKFSKHRINKFLDQVQAACNNFKTMRIYGYIAIFVSVLLTVLLITGNILLNIGLSKNTKTASVKIAKFNGSTFVILGSCFIFGGAAQFIVVMIFLAWKTRRIRNKYENITAELIAKNNVEIKEVGLRWKLGQYYNWIELCQDYKIHNVLTKQLFNSLLLNKMSLLESQQLPKNFV